MNVKADSAIASGMLLMLGEPDPIVLAPGQAEPTIEQMAKAYVRRDVVIDSIGVDSGEGDVGIPANSDMYYEDGVLRSSTTSREYAGVSRINVRDQVHVLDAAKGFTMQDRPDLPGLRAADLPRGFQANPATCCHQVKSFRVSRGWFCHDCGVGL